jgi:hypothetical protein
MDVSCSTREKNEKYVHNFSRKSEGKIRRGRSRFWPEDNINLDIEEVRCELDSSST